MNNFCLAPAGEIIGFHGWACVAAIANDAGRLPRIGEPCICGGVRYGYCPDCHEHLATESFSEGAIAYIHGLYETLCRCCVLKRQIRFAEEAAAKLGSLREKLAASDCGSPMIL